MYIFLRGESKENVNMRLLPSVQLLVEDICGIFLRVAGDSTKVITENLWVDETTRRKNILQRRRLRINTISGGL